MVDAIARNLRGASVCDTRTMAHPICVACSRPILPTDDRSTVEQVDACTMAVERITYYATCRDHKPARKA
jgi:hypothetical protein